MLGAVDWKSCLYADPFGCFGITSPADVLNDSMNDAVYGTTYLNPPMPPTPKPPTSMNAEGIVTDPNAVGQVIASQNTAWKASLQNFFNNNPGFGPGPEDNKNTTSSLLWLGVIGIGALLVIKKL